DDAALRDRALSSRAARPLPQGGRVMPEQTATTSQPVIRIADSDEEIARCFPVMRELRTHLAEDDFVPRVRLQQRNGYELGYLEDAGAVRAVAGFRVLENLASGRVLYVDDLVTQAGFR